MRLAVFCFLAAVCVTAFPVVAEARHLSRHHTIEIEVECIETAREIINDLNGYNLDSSASFTDNYRWANFTRRVEGWAFRHVQEVLRNLGEVLSEHENAHFLGPEILNTETRLLVLSQEIERLSLMMAASDSLSVLIAVNDRLSHVTRDRDALIGRRNVLLTQADSPIIHIHLVETPDDPPRPVPTDFGSRVARSFLNSWEHTRIAAENILVSIVGASVQVAVWVVVGGIAGLVIFKVNKKRRAKVTALAETEVNHETE